VEPAAPAKVDRKPVRPKTATKKKADPIAPAARRPDPAERVKTKALSAPPVVNEMADSPGRDQEGGNEKKASDGPVRPFGSGAQAFGPTGVAGGGGNVPDGPVGATFGDADGPRFVQRVMPHYPELARRRGREGLVLLRLVIGPGGELRDVRIIEGGGHGFDEAALAAVRASVYAPAMRDGRGVECAALLPVRFALKGS
jgi:protein TonB